jgi:hypothetical protein
MSDDATVVAAERAAPIAAPAEGGPIVPGSEAHKILFCRMLIDTHARYEPAAIKWPALEGEAQERLLSLPIWEIAVQTEEKAKERVSSYAERVADPLLRQAIALGGFEEGRHKEVLQSLVAAYGIPFEKEPLSPRPRDPEWAFMVTGYSECIDSFFAFGLFLLARRSGFFPPSLVAVFEPIMQEEGRHILFFVNWVAWHRKNLPWWRRPLFRAKILAVWAFLLGERVRLARGLGGRGGAAPADNNFTLSGSKALAADDLGAAELLDLCLLENERRLCVYDSRLLRPRAVPALSRLARRFLRGAQPA